MLPKTGPRLQRTSSTRWAFDLGRSRSLAGLPALLRQNQIPGARELIPHENYSLVYEIDGETVWVLTLVHTARQWPPARG